MFEQPGYPVTAAHDGALGRAGWAVMRGSDGEPAEAIFDLAAPGAVRPGSKVEVELAQMHGGRHLLGRWRLTVGAAEEEPLSPGLRRILVASPEERTPEEGRLVRAAHRARTNLLDEERAEKAALTARRAALESEIPQVLETRAVAPMVTRVLPRGNWMDESGDEVLPAVPTVLGGSALSAEERPDRLDLARWLVSEDNALVARVVALPTAGLQARELTSVAWAEQPPTPWSAVAPFAAFQPSVMLLAVLRETARPAGVRRASSADLPQIARSRSRQVRWKQ